MALKDLLSQFDSAVSDAAAKKQAANLADAAARKAANDAAVAASKALNDYNQAMTLVENLQAAIDAEVATQTGQPKDGGRVR